MYVAPLPADYTEQLPLSNSRGTCFEIPWEEVWGKETDNLRKKKCVCFTGNNQNKALTICKVISGQKLQNVL